jgi:hypothetical protein
MYDIEQHRERGDGPVVLDLRDQSLTDTGPGSQLFEGDVLLRSFGLDLIADE